MAKYRKKPVYVEAHRIGIDPWPDVAWEMVNRNEIRLFNCGETNGYIEIDFKGRTFRGDHGDYLVNRATGEWFPCKPDIFEATYEKVD